MTDHACVGKDGMGSWAGEGACPFAPVVFIAGDAACSYHVVSVVKLRLTEVKGKPVSVVLIHNGPWAL